MSQQNSNTEQAAPATSIRGMVGSVAIFAAKWAVAGLAFAAVLLWIRPDLRDSSTTSPPTQQAAPETPATAKPAQPPTQTILAPTAPNSVITSYADAVARSAPAVVNVFTARVVTELARPQGFDRLLRAQPPAVRQRIEGSLGSGVIIDIQGHVVTNHHVVANAQKIRLQLADGRIMDATLVGDDPEADLALLKIEASPSVGNAYPVMPLGRSDRLRIGDVALAIGYPYGLSQTVTHGIVSATGRDQLGLTQFESFIQTDAAINVGNSGGALINAQGELIGINTAVLGAMNREQGTTSQGIGFAIPVNMVRGVVEQLLKYGRVRRGWLGVTSDPVDPQRAAALGLKNTMGAQLTDVDANSPAAIAGLQAGDVLTALNSKSIRDVHEALNLVAALKPGARLRIQGRNDRGAIDVSVVIAERPTQ